MADGQVRYVVRLDDMNVVTQLRTMEGQAKRTEQSVASLQSSLRSMAGALGIGFGAHAFINFGKDAVQGAADYEVAMLRIMNASRDVKTGLTNQLFVTDEIKKFKIGLQETSDVYGSFLLKIKNAGMSVEAGNTMFDNILTISKVAALPLSEMESTIRNISIMMGEGVLEARHLRALSYVHPQILPFLAEEMGVKSGQADKFSDILKNEHDDATALQKIGLLTSSGKLTKMALDATTLLPNALQKYKDSVQDKLGSATETIESHITTLHNTWLEFKNDLVLTHKDDLIEFIGALKDGVGWLKEHDEDIVSLGKNVAAVTKIWLAYKGAMFMVNGAGTIYKGFMSWYTGESVKEIALTQSKTVAYNSLALAIERLNIANQQALVYGGAAAASSGGAAAAGGISVGGAAAALTGVSVVSGALLVAIAAGSVYAISDTLYKIMKGEEYQRGELTDVRQISENLYKTGSTLLKKDVLGKFVPVDKEDDEGKGEDWLLANYNKYKDSKDPFEAELYRQGKIRAAGLKKKPAAGGDAGHIIPPNDKVTGQRVIQYNITIKEINGIKQNTVNEGSKFDTQSVANEMADIIQSIVNDSQIRAGN